jgi:cell division septal protein FtsQ
VKGTPGDAVELRGRLAKELVAFQKRKIWEINLGEVKAAILRDQWVGDVRISRSLPNEIHVRVRTKNPVFVLVTTKGAMIPIGEDGTLVNSGVVSADRLPNVPLLRGDVFAVDAGRRTRAIEFAMALPDKGPLSRQNISEMAWAAEDGYTVTLINPKLEVKLGEDRVGLKVVRATQVLNYLSANHPPAYLRGRVIDASFSKKVLVRLRKGP